MTGTGKPIAARPLQGLRPFAGLARLLRGRAWHKSSFTGPAPRLPALLPGDPATAQQLYRGNFAFAGHRLDCRPAEVFAAQPPSAAWWDDLTSFDWLQHFEAAGLALYRAFARTMVTTFASQRLSTSFPSDCRRLAALSRHAGFLLGGAPETFAEEFLAIAGGEAKRLAAQRPRAAADRLRQSLALLTASLALRGNPGLRGESLARCAVLSAAAILGDGGPADRNPQSLLALLAELLPLREALETQRIPVPPGLDAAMARGLKALRLLSHGGRSLAIFQGVDTAQSSAHAAVLARNTGQTPPQWQAREAGYCRMSQGSATVIVDCGDPVLCDSALAFEFSDGGQRIAGSCGLPPHASPAWRQAACSAAAHSALHIEAPVILARRSAALPVMAELVASPHGTLFKGHSALAAAGSGIAYRRDLFLAANGHDLRGEDRFVRAPGYSGEWPDLGFVIRFHLAPGLRATLDRPDSAVTLVMPDRAVWQVTVRGGDIDLEDSIFLATGGGPEPCKQITIRSLIGRPERVNWAFKKLAVTETPARRSF